MKRKLFGFGMAAGETLGFRPVTHDTCVSIAQARNAGGFWNGLHQIGEHPADLLPDAWAKRADCRA